MKIRVTINGILEAEAEFESPASVSALGSSSWVVWEADHHSRALKFISECAKQAIAVAQGMPRELETTPNEARP